MAQKGITGIPLLVGKPWSCWPTHQQEQTSILFSSLSPSPWLSRIRHQFWAHLRVVENQHGLWPRECAFPSASRKPLWRQRIIHGESEFLSPKQLWSLYREPKAYPSTNEVRTFLPSIRYEKYTCSKIGSSYSMKNFIIENIYNNNLIFNS